MSSEQTIVDRVRELLADQADVVERRMFGGLVFMVNGHMTVGCDNGGEELFVRVGKERYVEALLMPHSKETSGNFRPMKGIVWVQSEGYASDEDLRTWVQMALEHSLSLPPK